MKNIFLIILVFALSQCTQEAVKIEPSEITLELKTNAEKQKFLQDLFDLDQKVRSESATICHTNFESYECAKSKIDQKSTDINNLLLISKYLDKYGHPSKQDFDEIPLITPWTILHHNVGAAAAMDRKYMPVLIKAWEKGDLEVDNLLWYLQRRYTIANRVKDVEYPEKAMSEVRKVHYLIEQFK